MTDIKPTRLVQRLHVPNGGLEQPFSTTSFFRHRVRESLADVFTLDYMGSSQFEFGAVPKAVDGLIEQRNKNKLRADVVAVIVSPNEYEKQCLVRDVEWHQRRLAEKDLVWTKKDLEHAQAAYEQGSQTQSVQIFIIAPRNSLSYAKNFIVAEAQDAEHLKEPSWFRQSMVGMHRFKKNLGWFELDNGFMFFRDWQMFDKTARLFEINHSIPQPASQIGPARSLETDRRLTWHFAHDKQAERVFAFLQSGGQSARTSDIVLQIAL